MARIKVFDTKSQSWVYADKSFGKDGITPVKGVDYFDGNPGRDGVDGKDGSDGYTPVVGVDYYTEADKAEFSEYIAAELAKRSQLKPEFAESEEWLKANGDTTKLYVLDGMIWAHMLTTVTKPDQPQYTNVLPLAIDTGGSVYNGTGYKNGYRLNSSGIEKEAEDCGHTGFIKVTNGSIVRMKNHIQCVHGYEYIHFFNASFTKVNTYQPNDNFPPDVDGIYTFNITSTCEYIRISAGEFTEETIITVNEEIKVIPGETTTGYQWTNTGYAFVSAGYEDRIFGLENKVKTLADEIENGLEAKPDLLYISTDGDDSNDGLTASTPKKTVKACVEAGAKRISAKRGIYKEAINLQNIGSLEIFPTDNEKTYVVGECRQHIVFDTSDVLAVSSIASYNSIKRIAYNNASNVAYDKVFVKKTLAPAVSASQSSYHAAVWLFSDDEKTVCRKPKPVLTIAECEAETNTFCYSDGYIYINADLTGVTKIVVPTITVTGFYVNGANNLVLREVEVRFSGEYSFDLRNCALVDLYKCASKYTTRASGFHPVNTNGVFRACYATKCFDGFAPNGHGHTTYIDCVSEFNFDDGMSHHSSTEGTVIGGRYEGNGKGGNTPAYGAKVNIYGGLYKNNAQFGIGYVGSAEAGYVSGIVQGAVMVNNPIGLLVQANCEVTAISCKYTGNTSDKNIQGVLTEY
jgi:hypothetical protein